jgi:hypothetical protein
MDWLVLLLYIGGTYWLIHWLSRYIFKDFPEDKD